MCSDHPHLLSQVIIIRRDHSSLSGCHILARIEAEAGCVTYRAGSASLVFRTMSLGRILNDYESAVACQFHYRIHIRAQAVHVHR
jgi:hypothetical protein